jgi:hypothetical protein
VLCDDRTGAVPRQQLCDAVDGVLGDTLEHVARLGFRIEAIQRGGRDQRGDGGRAPSHAEEPDAGKLHVRVCEGWGRQRPHLLGTRPRRQGCCRVVHRSRCSRPRAARR